MTLDDLIEAYFNAHKPVCDYLCKHHYDDISTAPHRAGIRAVVEALRDEGRLRDTDRLLQEILASDGVEAAYQPDFSQPHPSDAAPVCEWTKHAEKSWTMQCTPGFYNPHPKRLAAKTCAMCQRPISIKSEAAR